MKKRAFPNTLELMIDDRVFFTNLLLNYDFSVVYNYFGSKTVVKEFLEDRDMSKPSIKGDFLRFLKTADVSWRR